MKALTILLAALLTGCAGTQSEERQYDRGVRSAEFYDQFFADTTACKQLGGRIRIIRRGPVPSRCLRFDCPPDPTDRYECIR